MATTVNSQRSDGRFYIVAAAVLFLLLLGRILSPPTSATGAPLSINSDGPNGAMALREWIERGGNEIVALTSLDDLEAEPIDVLFILYPLLGYDSSDATLLNRWLREGHTLIVAGEPSALNPLLATYQMELAEFTETESSVDLSAPSLLNPPFNALTDTPLAYVRGNGDFATHLRVNEQPVVVSLDVGRGRLWVLGVLTPFTNRGLHDTANASLVANLLAAMPRHAVVAFDESGRGADDTDSLFSWLFKTAPGLGVLTAFALVMLFLASQGRRFGKAVPLPENRQRRESVEYVQALAGLFRRSGDRQEVQRHYAQQLRRALARRYGIDPAASDAELIRMVSERVPDVDAQALHGLLTGLRRQRINEADLVALVSRLNEFLKGLS